MDSLLIGFMAFVIIGLLHPVVIKAEYYIGKKIWPVFLISGTIANIASLIVSNQSASILLAILGFSLYWSINELFEQEKRVQRGWFSENPKRRKGNGKYY